MAASEDSAPRAYEGAPKFQAFMSDRERWTHLQINDSPVIEAADIPFENAPMGKIRYYLHHKIYPDRALTDWLAFMMELGDASGRHVHQGGVVIYVIEGEGYTIVDGERDEWRAGDLLLLPIRQGGVDHQHFNSRPGEPCRWFAAVNFPVFNQLGSEMTQREYATQYRSGEPDPGFVGPPKPIRATTDKERRTSASVESPAKERQDRPEPAGMATPFLSVGRNGPERHDALAQQNMYDALLEIRDQQRDGWLRHGLRVISSEFLPWEWSAWGLMRWYMHPAIYDTCIRSHIVYEQKLPPGGSSGLMRHQGNSLLLVTKGEGYTTVDGERNDWKEEDVIQLPARSGGVIFRHFNASDKQEACLVGFELNTTDALGVDRGSGFECLEPAPIV